jgi:hypothetical protein
MRLPVHLSHVECLVVVAIILVLLGLVLPSLQDRSSWNVQEELASWRAGPDVEVAESSLLSSDVDLRGAWQRGGVRGRCSLKVLTTSIADTYLVEFQSTWGEWRTTAFRVGPRLTLGHPVAENPETVFDTLWIIHLDGDDYLLPMARVTDFNQARLDVGAEHLSRMHAFRRVGD